MESAEPTTAGDLNSGGSRRSRRRKGFAYWPGLEVLEARLTPTVSFATQQTFSVGSDPTSVATADFNGDGKPDLVIGTQGNESVAVLLDTTAAGAVVPSFSPVQTFAVGNSPDALTVADFNGDGKPDLAAVNIIDQTVSVLLNTTPAGASTVSFAPQHIFLIGFDANAVVAADLNGDGKPDLIVANSNNNNPGTLSVLLNTTAAGSTTASFAPQQTFAAGNGPFKEAAGDFNGDGKPDLVYLDGGAITPQASVLPDTTAAGAATVTFAPVQTVPTGRQADYALVGDVNGDGKPDLVVTNGSDKSVSVLLNMTPTGSATMSFAQQTFAVGTLPDSVVAADFDADGRPDLAVTNANDNTVSVLVNTTPTGGGTASFASQLTFAVGTNPAAVSAADFNGDGLPDLVVADGNNNAVSVLLNTSPVPPTAHGQTVVIGQGQARAIALTGSAPGGDAFTFAITANPSHGALSGFNAATGAGTYTPAGTYTGPDSFQFTVTDAVTHLTSAAATVSLTVTAPAVVGQFGNQGVWELNGVTGAWAQLTAANATLLADDPAGDAAAEFPGYGVWRYTPAAGWKQLHPVDVTLLAMDALGDVVVNFPGYGVGQYLPGSGWRLLTAANASLLSVDANGDIAAEFPGYGVWEFTTASNGWKQLHSVDVTLLAMDAAGDVAANFPGYGVGRYTAGTGWRLLDGVQASALAMDAFGDVAAEFPGYGVGEFPADGGGARELTAANAALLGADAFGAFYAEFAGYGVWRYDPTHGWVQLTAADATLLAVA
jgi:hypothetical protein